MMDIVERLRKDARGPALEAADEIERLRSMTKVNLDAFHNNVVEIERLREALEEIMHYDVAWHSEEVGTVDGFCAAIARSALQQKESE